VASSRELAAVSPARPAEPRALIMVDGSERSGLGAALERVGFKVDFEPVGLAEAPDVVIAQRRFGNGRGSLALSFLRPLFPKDSLRLISQFAEREQAALARELGVSPESLARRLADLLPALSRRAALDFDAATRSPAEVSVGRFALQRFLQEIEDALIVLMLAAARSDREAADFLGLNEATLRSKMKKRQIRSPRARSARSA